MPPKGPKEIFDMVGLTKERERRVREHWSLSLETKSITNPMRQHDDSDVIKQHVEYAHIP